MGILSERRKNDCKKTKKNVIQEEQEEEHLHINGNTYKVQYVRQMTLGEQISTVAEDGESMMK
jgi:hypothetical protein